MASPTNLAVSMARLTRFRSYKPLAKARTYSFYLRLVLGLILIGMMIYRLVAIQLREFTTEISPVSHAALISIDRNFESECRVPPQGPLSGYGIAGPQSAISPGFFAYLKAFCSGGVLNLTDIVKWNEWYIISAAISVALFSRLIIAEWVLALSVGVILLSRGSLLHGIGRIHPDALINVGFSLWFLAVTLFLRTGTKGTLLFSLFISAFLTLLDASFSFLTLVLPAIFLVARLIPEGSTSRFKAQNEPTQTSILRPLEFGTWVRSGQNRGFFFGYSACFLVLNFFLLRYQNWAVSHLMSEFPVSAERSVPTVKSLLPLDSIGQFLAWAPKWLSFQIETIDRHFAGSALLVLLSLFARPKNRPSTLRQASLCAGLALFFIILTACYIDYNDAQKFIAANLIKNSADFIDPAYLRQVTYWLDTAFIGLGATAFFHWTTQVPINRLSRPPIKWLAPDHKKAKI